MRLPSIELLDCQLGVNAGAFSQKLSTAAGGHLPLFL
jgi:hypothetical protein